MPRAFAILKLGIEVRKEAQMNDETAAGSTGAARILPVGDISVGIS